MSVFSPTSVNVYRANRNWKKARPADVGDRVDKAARASFTINGSYKKQHKNKIQEAEVYATFQNIMFNISPNGDLFF